ncbi:MAG: glycosyltransferase [Bacteroidota bacterium]
MHKWDDARIFKRATRHLSSDGQKVSYIATSEKQQSIDGIDFYPLQVRTGWRRRLFSSREAYQVARSLKADIYHFHDPDLIPWMFLLSLQGKKVIYDIHENFYEKFHHLSFPLKQLLSFLYSMYELPIRSFAGVVAVSESLRQMYAGKSRSSIVVMNVPPKSTLPEVQNNGRRERLTIYISGQQSEKRNCTQIVEALPRIKETFPEIKLQLVGRFVPESYEQTLVDKAASLGVQDNLIIEGMLPWEENFKRTAKATLGCVFYEDNPNNRVGIPNRLFEYMASGIPILAENFVELQRIVRDADCGVLVDSSNPAEIAQAALEVLSDQEKALEMGQNGRQAVIQKYNFNEELKKLESFYQQILEDHHE